MISVPRSTAWAGRLSRSPTRNAVRNNFEDWQSAWEELEVTVEEIIDAGDRVVHTAHYRGCGRGSGIEVEARYYEVYILREGRIIRVDEYTERIDALEAAGLYL